MNLTLSIAALAALLPASLLPYRAAPARDAVFWMLLGAALLGPLLMLIVTVQAGWRSGLTATLWVVVVGTLLIYGFVAALSREAWRLAGLLFPYVFLLALLATVLPEPPERTLSAGAPAAWTGLHIVLAVAAYALLTLGAVAGFAVFLQERALKAHRPTPLTHRLPSVADSEALQVGLLTASAVVLACGLVTGMAVQYVETGTPLVFAHKTLLAFLTFAVILALLIAHHRTGVRGRRAARVVLLAYLLLTLAYPGVKFVTDVVLV